MKRWYQIMIGITSAAALIAAAITMTAGSTEAFRTGIGRVLTATALMGIVACAMLRPKALRTDMEMISAAGTGQEGAKIHTFSDVAANDEARRSLEQLKDYIVNPEKYRSYGARMPRGILLYGPPGTGKTLLAKALAGEAGVPYFALTGSDFVEKYVGVGAMRVRDLFRKARKAGKCVIFIDEIDAMGKKRQEQSSDERDQTLNALLSEMSGFRSGDGIVVLAATNRPEMLDPALLRPGRFDRQIEVGLPGRKERLSILRLHSRNKPMDVDVNLEQLAAETAYFSGAALENLLNEAAIYAAQTDRNTIAMEDLQAAMIRTRVGEDRESAATDREKRMIAVHEAGHALMIRLLTPENRLTRVSILPASGGAAGYNLTVPAECVMSTKGDYENQVCVLLAGRAAEALTEGENGVTSGAANDLARANEIVAAMVTEFGMAGEPAVSAKVLAKSCGELHGTAEKCREILAQLYERSCLLLGQNRDALESLAEALVRYETLTGEEAETFLGELSNDFRKSPMKDKN